MRSRASASWGFTALMLWMAVVSAQDYGQITGDPVVSGTLPGSVTAPGNSAPSNSDQEQALPTDDVVRESVSVEKPAPAPAFTLPKRGTLMTEVEREFGKPVRAVAAVGTPPITRWEYQHFTIYFEHDRVLHAVSNEKKRVNP